MYSMYEPSSSQLEGSVARLTMIEDGEKVGPFFSRGDHFVDMQPCLDCCSFLGRKPHNVRVREYTRREHFPFQGLGKGLP